MLHIMPLSLMIVYGLVSVFIFSLAEDRGAIAPVGGAECKNQNSYPYSRIEIKH